METAALCKPIQRFADLLRIPDTWVLTGLGKLLAALGSFPHFPQPLRLLHTHLYWRFLECQSIEVTLTQNGHLTHHEIPSVASLRPGGHFPRIGWPVSPEYATKRIQEMIGEAGLFQVDCWSPLDEYAEYAVGIEALPDICRNDREFFDALLDVFWRYSLEMTRLYLEAGAECLNVSWLACGESSGWTADEFRTIFLPFLKQHVELAHEYGAIYDYVEEAKVARLLPMLREAEVDIVHTLAPPPSGDVDLASAKKEIGDRVCLRGNLDSEGVLLKGTPSDVDQAVRETILTAGPGGGFILGCSDTISTDMPIENVRAFFGAGRKYGNYRHLGHEG